MASEEEEDYDDEDFEEEEFPDDFEEEVDSASEGSGDLAEADAESQEYAESVHAEGQAVGDPSEEEVQRELEDSEGAHSQSADPATHGDLADVDAESQEYADSEHTEGQAVGDPSEEEVQRELEDSEGAHSQSADPATNGDLADVDAESQEYADSEHTEGQAVGDPSEEEVQRELEDSEGAHSQSADPATNGDLADADAESHEYADSEHAEGQAVGDLAEDVGEDQEVQQEPEDNEMEHREAADGDTMIGVLPEDVGQEQEVTQEHGDIDNAEEVHAATISGDLSAEAKKQGSEQHEDKETASGPGEAPEEAIKQELHEHESADVQAVAETMSGELADVEHDQVVQQSAPEAVNTAPSGEGHLAAEEPQQAATEALETSHTSAPELIHSLLMESSLGSRHWSQLPEGHVAVGRHRENRVATAPSKRRRPSPPGQGRPARAKREGFAIVKLEQPEQRSASWVKAPEEPWSRRAPQRIKQAYCGSLVMLPKLKKPAPAEAADAHSSVRKGAAPRASPGAEREPFEPRQLQDFLSSPSADIWRYYCPEQKASGDAAIVAG